MKEILKVEWEKNKHENDLKKQIQSQAHAKTEDEDMTVQGAQTQRYSKLKKIGDLVQQA